MIWNETRYTWESNQLVAIWSFASDWKPEPNASNFSDGIGGLSGWEPVFHPVDANNFIYVPGAAGTVWKVNKDTGMPASQINPLNGVSGISAANTFVSGRSIIAADVNRMCPADADSPRPASARTSSPSAPRPMPRSLSTRTASPLPSSTTL